MSFFLAASISLVIMSEGTPRAYDAAMHPTYSRLTSKLLSTLADLDSACPEWATPKPYWVCIAGGPGSGKSTLAEAIAERVNAEQPGACVVLPMDGFHYSRSELKRLDPPDATSFLPRRGSPWTFDAEGCFAAFRAAKADGEGQMPTYSRELSDPVPGGVRLERSHRLVLCEGNYLLGAEGEQERWAPLATLWDETWFVRCPDAAAQRRRLIARHLETWNEEKSARWGVGEAGAAARADANDVLNMELIRPCEARADLIIDSLD